MSENHKLSGAQEVPPVSTSGSGSGSITVLNDGSIRGSIKISGLAGTALTCSPVRSVRTFQSHFR